MAKANAVVMVIASGFQREQVQRFGVEILMQILYLPTQPPGIQIPGS
jgi:hypothetical protein